jgi:pentatricopeptide repeat protein
MICWYCHWGWPEKVAEIYQEALSKLKGNPSPLNFGPGHVVWEEENFDLAQSCIDDFSKYSYDLTDEEKEIVMWSLVELDKLPLSEREIVPDGYDGQHPENFPPPDGVKVVKVQPYRLPDGKLWYPRRGNYA